MHGRRQGGRSRACCSGLVGEVGVGGPFLLELVEEQLVSLCEVEAEAVIERLHNLGKRAPG
jgi:hypothetical protein